jgi:putative transposase
MSTYLSLHYHIVFGTKNREPIIKGSVRTRLHEYLGGTIRGLGGFPQGVGGVEDHVHILAGLPATLCLSDLMRELKKASSGWMRTEGGLPHFNWQQGYAAFSVGAPSREAIKRYIAHQEEHHRKSSFREELVKMLAAAGVAYDDRFLE